MSFRGEEQGGSEGMPTPALPGQLSFRINVGPIGPFIFQLVLQGLRKEGNRGVPKDVLAQELESQTSNSPKEGSCAICMCDYEESSSVVGLKACGHEFCRECVSQWLEKENTCPLCRAVAITPAPGSAWEKQHQERVADEETSELGRALSEDFAIFMQAMENTLQGVLLEPQTNSGMESDQGSQAPASGQGRPVPLTVPGLVPGLISRAPHQRETQNQNVHEQVRSQSRSPLIFLPNLITTALPPLPQRLGLETTRVHHNQGDDQLSGQSGNGVEMNNDESDVEMEDNMD